MRITESILYQQIARDVRAAQSNMERKSRPVRTGYKNNLPSDDPAYTEQVSRLKRGFQETHQFRRNIDRTSNYFTIVESTSQHVSDVMVDLQTLAISMANDHLTEADRAAGAKEAAQLLKTLEGLANSQFDGRYVFGGRKSNAKPYDAALNFVGDSVGREVQISTSLNVDGDLPGTELFGDAAGGQVTAFAAAQNLITALNANNTGQVQTALGELTDAHNTVVATQAKVGGILHELHQTDFFHDDDEFNKQRIYADLTNADITHGASELAFAETVLTASVETARQLNRSLAQGLDFMI